MSTLSILVANMEVKGINNYTVARIAAKEYLTRLSPDQFKEQLQDITQEIDLRHLVSLGVVGEKWGILSDYIRMGYNPSWSGRY